jgi:Ti-type conjugative transfer relaxase TraA
MVADIGIHRDNPVNPHAHILLTTRDLTPEGFGQKNRSWNDKAHLLAWRSGWTDVTNEHLMRAGLAVRIDHRSYAEQKLDLIPGRKLGLDNQREKSPDLPGFLADRVAEQHRIAQANGTQIIAEPAIALKALSQSNATFTHHDIAKFLHTRTSTADQFQTAYLKVTTSSELLPLGVDEAGRQRFTTREMFEAEQSLLTNADKLAHRASHGVDAKRRAAVLTNHTLSAEQGRAVEEITSQGVLKSLVGVAGSGKSTTLAAMREVWEKEGYTVKGAALAGIAAENLQVSSGIQSRTLASYELAWSRGRDPLTHRDVLVIDEAGMLGTRQLERVLEVAQKAHAKVILIGDPEQLQAIEAGAPFRGVTQAHGVTTLTEVRRQKLQWQRTATANLSAGKTAEALNAYDKEGGIVPVEKRQDARRALIARWAKDLKLEPKGSQLILAYTRDEVQELNSQVRALRQQTHQLGRSEMISTERGKREFSLNDRIRFGRNERDLGVKNGSLGTIERIERGVLQIKLDGDAGARVAVDSKFYKHLDYGYATTVHKAQGTTVDRTYVLATPPHFDRHLSNVALSRHREAATVFYASDDFGGRSGAPETEIRARFIAALSRAKPKELAHDYLDRESGSDATLVSRLVVSQWEKERNAEPRSSTMSAHLPTNDLDARQQAAAERWAARQKSSPTSGQRTDHSKDHSPSRNPSHERDRTPDFREDGPEHDLDL